MPPNVSVDTDDLLRRLLLEGCPSHILDAVMTLTEHHAAGLPIPRTADAALRYIVGAPDPLNARVRPQPAPVDLFSRVRPGEVF